MSLTLRFHWFSKRYKYKIEDNNSLGTCGGNFLSEITYLLVWVATSVATRVISLRLWHHCYDSLWYKHQRKEKLKRRSLGSIFCCTLGRNNRRNIIEGVLLKIATQSSCTCDERVASQNWESLRKLSSALSSVMLVVSTLLRPLFCCCCCCCWGQLLVIWGSMRSKCDVES